MLATLVLVAVTVVAAVSPIDGRDAVAGHDGLAVNDGSCFLLDGLGGLTSGTGLVVQTKHGVVGICLSPPVAPPEGRDKVVWTNRNTGKECGLPQGAGFTHTSVWREKVRTVVDPELGPVGIATLLCFAERDRAASKGNGKPARDTWPRR